MIIRNQGLDDYLILGAMVGPPLPHRCKEAVTDPFLKILTVGYLIDIFVGRNRLIWATHYQCSRRIT